MSLHEAGKLLEARARLTECAVAACPTVIRETCEKQLQELNGTIPTIIFEPKDGEGHDLAGADVAIDDKPSVKLTGAAIELDTGDHRFTFSVPGQPPVSATFTLRDGEKGRRERILIGPMHVEKAVVASPSTDVSTKIGVEEPSVSKSERPRGKMQTILGIASGAVGLAGLGVGTAFGLMAFSEKSKETSSGCTATSCTPSQHTQADTAHTNSNTNGTISTVGFAAGGVFLAGSVVMLLTASRRVESPPVSAITAVPSIGPTGGGMLLRGEF